MSKPNYRVIVTYDAERKVYCGRAPELEHCTGEGASRAEAIARVEEEIDAQLANMLSHGTTPPRSVDEEVFSGEVSAKVSSALHRDLAYQARSEGIEIDHLIGELLASAIEGRRQTHRPQRGGNRQDHPNDGIGNRHEGPRRQGGFGGRGNYHQVMDDRANFIEYVRGLEQGGHGNRPPHGGGHGPGPGGRRRRRGGGGGNGQPRHAGHDGRGNYGGGPGGMRNGGPGANPNVGSPGGGGAPMEPAPPGADRMGGSGDDNGNR
jgi:predicted RNase H-like HicB family nuclease